MKRLFLVLVVLIGLFLPQALRAEGNNKPRYRRTVVSQKRGSKKAVAKSFGCARLKGKAKKRCEARAVAAAELARRRAEEARRRAELAAQAQENRLRTEAKANIAVEDSTGEDQELRDAIVKAFDGKAGTALVMETKTGKVDALVNKAWGVHQSFKPCSTIKLVTGIAGVTDNTEDEDDIVDDPEFSAKLEKAIAKSDNGYFQRMGSKVGIEKFINTAKKLGLGKPTGLNLPGEASGQIPLVKKTALQYSHGDDSKLTILQLGVLASEITNGGLKPVPTIQKTSQTELAKPTLIDVPQDVLKEMIPGMKGVADFGTARKSIGSQYGMAGKTGTCSDNISRMGLFTSVAPITDPKYTVVVVIRGRRDQTNGPYAARIAGKIYQFLFAKEASLAKAEQSPAASAAKQQ